MFFRELGEKVKEPMYFYGYGKTSEDAADISDWLLRMDVYPHLADAQKQWPSDDEHCTYIWQTFCFRGAKRYTEAKRQEPDLGDSGGPVIYRRKGLITHTDNSTESYNQTVLVGVYIAISPKPSSIPLAVAINAEFFHNWITTITTSSSVDKKKTEYPNLYTCCDSIDDEAEYEARHNITFGNILTHLPDNVRDREEETYVYGNFTFHPPEEPQPF